MLAKEIGAIILAYLLGSIPFAYLMGRAFKGIDIRKKGNVGTLSVMREVGPAAGFANLVLDAGKGSLAVVAAQLLDVPALFIFISGFAAVIGHLYPVFLRFRGGGGLATTLGVLAAIAPAAFGISFAITVIAVLITSNVRLGAGIGLVFLPLFIWLLGGHPDLIFYSIGLSLFLVLSNTLRFQRELSANKEKKGLIFDRDFTPWQTRRKKDQK
jgi:acyl phosphate:glycerol-3-phosphate acyltransferase